MKNKLGMEITKTIFKVLIDGEETKLETMENEIIENIKSLERNKILKIREFGTDFILVDFSSSETKISEVFSVDEIDKLLKEFDYFVNKYEGLILNTNSIIGYIDVVKTRLAKDEIAADLNDIIKSGIESIFDKKALILLEKKLYNLCENALEKDLEIVEIILFCLYNFEKTENPFLVTLFLASIYKNIN